MTAQGVPVSAGGTQYVLVHEEVSQLLDYWGIYVRGSRSQRDGLVVQAIHRETRSTIKLAKLVGGAGNRQWASQAVRGGDFRRANIVVGGGPARKNESWASKFPTIIRDQFAALAQSLSPSPNP
ncbi:hypothetical protein RB25_17925 [Herbaspirillum rubrisubalbicans]|uniref:hypothetical protein n=1 Tax=Herbaspirillum rubrisubalbicans TaxID=80842 RepID=UPI000DC50DF4|nr:hypothetical protein [Herbaspirillum rubrisubalbicans]RAN45640.1 hypothetical protein RB25_17925 [Herbaspirillum rubrisubalbicans]